MRAVAGEGPSPVRGILVAGDFPPDIVVAARETLNVELRRYRTTFTFDAVE
jgi:hypothetical protein